MRSKKYQAAYEAAQAMDAELMADDDRLYGTVHVAHEDGTSLLFVWAFAEQHRVAGNVWWIVFTEHHGAHVFDPEDVKVRRMGAPL